MKNTLLFFVGVLVSTLIISFTAFKGKTEYQESKPKYLHVNVLESVLEGGMGRSRCIVTFPDGNSEEFDLDNYYSLVGANFGNIKANDKKLTLKINQLAEQGYQIISQSSGGQGIYSTKIIMEKK